MGLKDILGTNIGQKIGSTVDSYWAKAAAKGRSPLLHNIEASTANNLFTGLKLKKGVTKLGILGVAAYAGIKTAKGIAAKGTEDLHSTDMGEAGYLSYDQGMQGRTDFGATGDIIFGMHKRR